MKRLFSVATLTSLLLTMASIAWATSNLNLSKSNINRTEQKAACLEKATTDQAKAACEKKFAEQAKSILDSAPTIRKGGGTTVPPSPPGAGVGGKEPASGETSPR